jgi:sugar/nucleoside kinase (ribokinase family)
VFRISVAGHLCVDLVPALPANARLAPGQLIQVGALDVRLGGCVANTGLWLLRLGGSASPYEVRLQGVVGDDELGAIAAQMLGDAADLHVLEGATTSYSIVLEPGGADRTFWHHTGANSLFDPENVGVDADLLHFGYPPLLPLAIEADGVPLRDLFARAKQAGVTTSLDLAVVDPDAEVGQLDWSAILHHVLTFTDVISPSYDDLASMYRLEEPASLAGAAELAKELIASGAGIAMVTAGAQGFALRTGSRARLAAGGRVVSPLAEAWADLNLTLPPLPVDDIVTSTGAGDAATAGLLHALASGLAPDAATQAIRQAAADKLIGAA